MDFLQVLSSAPIAPDLVSLTDNSFTNDKFAEILEKSLEDGENLKLTSQESEKKPAESLLLEQNVELFRVRPRLIEAVALAKPEPISEQALEEGDFNKTKPLEESVINEVFNLIGNIELLKQEPELREALVDLLVVSENKLELEKDIDQDLKALVGLIKDSLSDNKQDLNELKQILELEPVRQKLVQLKEVIEPKLDLEKESLPKTGIQEEAKPLIKPESELKEVKPLIKPELDLKEAKPLIKSELDLKEIKPLIKQELDLKEVKPELKHKQLSPELIQELNLEELEVKDLKNNQELQVKPAKAIDLAIARLSLNIKDKLEQLAEVKLSEVKDLKNLANDHELKLENPKEQGLDNKHLDTNLGLFKKNTLEKLTKKGFSQEFIKEVKELDKFIPFKEIQSLSKGQVEVNIKSPYFSSSSRLVVMQVMEQIQRIAPPEVTKIKMILKPESLGELKLELSQIKDKGLLVKIETESQAVKQILERNQYSLKDALKVNNLEQAEIKITVKEAEKDNFNQNFNNARSQEEQNKKQKHKKSQSNQKFSLDLAEEPEVIKPKLNSGSRVDLAV